MIKKKNLRRKEGLGSYEDETKNKRFTHIR